jgi:hypothetical protein
MVTEKTARNYQGDLQGITREICKELPGRSAGNCFFGL